MHGVAAEVSVHREVTDTSAALQPPCPPPPSFQLLQLFTAGRSPGTFPKAEEEGGEEEVPTQGWSEP